MPLYTFLVHSSIHSLATYSCTHVLYCRRRIIRHRLMSRGYYNNISPPKKAGRLFFSAFLCWRFVCSRALAESFSLDGGECRIFILLCLEGCLFSPPLLPMDTNWIKILLWSCWRQHTSKRLQRFLVMRSASFNM
jgi:hypothetical protein